MDLNRQIIFSDCFTIIVIIIIILYDKVASWIPRWENETKLPYKQINRMVTMAHGSWLISHKPPEW